MRAVWRLIKALVVVLAIVVAIPLVGLAYGFLTTDAPSAPAMAAAAPEQAALSARLAADIPGYKRPEESTFLTYPEWSIVYAAREYADFVDERPPSGFAYWAHIGRFWKDYAAMIRASAPYPFNFDNHLMLVVIGISHTVEHGLQWLYENSVGRLSDLTGKPVEQDRFLAAMAGQYARFLDQTPWYEFPYADMRAALWNGPVAHGLAAVRSWERRLGFGLALTIKQTYADLIKSGLSATSDPAALDIHVWAKGPVGEAIAGEADTMIERDLGDDGAVFVTRRYQVFTDMIPRLIARGVQFVEIGGNDEILVTMLADEELDLPDGARRMFAYAVPTEPGTTRLGFAAPVGRLHEILPALTEDGARLEHVYDY